MRWVTQVNLFLVVLTNEILLCHTGNLEVEQNTIIFTSIERVVNLVEAYYEKNTSSVNKTETASVWVIMFVNKFVLFIISPVRQIDYFL